MKPAMVAAVTIFDSWWTKRVNPWVISDSDGSEEVMPLVAGAIADALEGGPGVRFRTGTPRRAGFEPRYWVVTAYVRPRGDFTEVEAFLAGYSNPEGPWLIRLYRRVDRDTGAGVTYVYCPELNRYQCREALDAVYRALEYIYGVERLGAREEAVETQGRAESEAA